MGCLFCNIIKGEVPSKKVYENERVYAFEDINPCAPVHVLVVHKTHIRNIDELDHSNAPKMADLFRAVKEIARSTGLEADGYRVIINNGKAGGQVIWHLHVHVLGGLPDLGPMLSV